MNKVGLMIGAWLVYGASLYFIGIAASHGVFGYALGVTHACLSIKFFAKE